VLLRLHLHQLHRELLGLLGDTLELVGQLLGRGAVAAAALHLATFETPEHRCGILHVALRLGKARGGDGLGISTAAVLAAVLAVAAASRKRRGDRFSLFWGTGHFVYTLKKTFFTPST